MCTKRLVAIALLTTLGLLVPTGLSQAQAGAIEDPLLASDNLTIHQVIPAPAAIGARFRGSFMYLTTSTGLVIYDISNPTTPAEVGRLALPHFENEDVDLGGNILLISNDAAESYGLLHVIDISDPTAPSILTSYHMGSNPVGTVVDAADFFGVVPDQGNPGHTASCILECAFAWVTDAGGMRLIDLRTPATPSTLGNFGTPAAGSLGITHDVQMDENGIAWISGYGGVAGYGIPADYADEVTAAAAAGGAAINDYHKSLLVSNTDPSGHSRYAETFGVDDGSTYNDYILHNSRRLEDSDVVYVTEEDYNRPGCEGAGSFETWRLPMSEQTDADGNVSKVITGEPMTPIDKWETEILTEDTEAEVRPQPTAMCSAHYFDVLQNVVAQSWYEQGMRLLDVSDPADIRQIGYFIPPNGESWATYFAPTDKAGRVMYVLDASLGLVVLEYDRPTEGSLAMPKPDPPLLDDGDKDSDDGGDDGGTGGGSAGGTGGGNDGGTGGGNDGGGDASSGGSTPPPTSVSSDSSSGAAESATVTKKPCKAKKTPKARRACRKRRGRSGAAAAGTSSSESHEPTVVAPIRAEWFSSAPASAPSRNFGYACRIVL